MMHSILNTLFLAGLVAGQNHYVSQRDTDSVLGTDEAPTLSKFLSNNPLPNGFPWGSRTANNTNSNPPFTGVIRPYDFTIRREQKAPDGYLRDVITINGQYPGPMIEANWGDTIQVTVHNEIDNPPEGTSLHWHGLLQKTSQWMDGVPAVSQCPIPPGGTFTYTFQADLYGTSWYHSHYSAQYSGGELGPMIIYGPETIPYDIDVGPILLTDWYHRDYFSILEDVMGPDPTKIIPVSDNNLINGKGNFNCSAVAPGDTTPCKDNAPLANFRFSPGKVHRLRLINAGSEAVQKFTLDGHNMTIVANDFVPIIPYDTQVVTLGVGQRTDVLITGLPGATGSYRMRSSIAGPDCSSTNNPEVDAIVYYQHEDLNLGLPNTTAWSAWIDSINDQCANDNLTLTMPWYPITPNPNPSTTQVINIFAEVNATNHTLWTMNGETFRGDYNSPILLLSNLGNNSYPYSPEWNVYNFGSNSSIRFVINNPIPAPHPMHLHGHSFFVLAAGQGTWDGTITNSNNPQRRDVQILPPSGFLVIQVTADNPGAWPLHCHIAWHVSAGLYITVLERPEDIANLKIPSIMAQTCRDWSEFTGEDVVDQIDSGL